MIFQTSTDFQLFSAGAPKISYKAKSTQIWMSVHYWWAYNLHYEQFKETQKRPNQSQMWNLWQREFRTKNGLKNHFNITHDLQKEHLCNICQKAFNILNQLTTHMKVVHSKNKAYHKCESCGKALSDSGKLKRYN